MNQHDDIPGPSELPRLAAALREIERPPSVPESIDHAILGSARPTSRGPQSRDERETRDPTRETSLVRAFGLVAAAAAVLLVAGVAAWRAGRPEPAAARSAAQEAAKVARAPAGDAPGFAVATSSADLNADGTVDIIDAYLLARRIERERGTLDVAKLDQDADGALTRADVDAIAMIAVALPGRPR